MSDLLKDLGLNDKNTENLISLTENLMEYEQGNEVIFQFVKLLSDTQMIVYVLNPKEKTFLLKKVWLKGKIKNLITEDKIKQNEFYYLKCLGLKKAKGKKNSFYDFEVKHLVNFNVKDYQFVD